MTTKTISGYYKNGYTLSASYSGLDITSTADVSGGGVVATASASIVNHGRAGGNSREGYNGVNLEAGGYQGNRVKK